MQSGRLRALDDIDPWSSELALSESSYTPDETASDVSSPSTESDDEDDDDTSSTTPTSATRAEDDDDDDEDETAAERSTTQAAEAKDDDDDDENSSPKSYAESDSASSPRTQGNEDDEDDEDDDDSKATTVRMNEIIVASESKTSELPGALSGQTFDSTSSSDAKTDIPPTPVSLSSSGQEAIIRRTKRAACPCALAKLFERIKDHK